MVIRSLLLASSFIAQSLNPGTAPRNHRHLLRSSKSGNDPHSRRPFDALSKTPSYPARSLSSEYPDGMPSFSFSPLQADKEDAVFRTDYIKIKPFERYFQEFSNRVQSAQLLKDGLFILKEEAKRDDLDCVAKRSLVFLILDVWQKMGDLVQKKQSYRCNESIIFLQKSFAIIQNLVQVDYDLLSEVTSNLEDIVSDHMSKSKVLNHDNADPQLRVMISAYRFNLERALKTLRLLLLECD